MIYKAVSIRQPWCDLIMNGQPQKDIENRTADSPVARQLAAMLAAKRQPITILIHAGKNIDPNAIAWAEERNLLRSHCPIIETLPTGGIVGVMRIRGIFFLLRNGDAFTCQTIGHVPRKEQHIWPIASSWADDQTGRNAYIYIDKAASIPFVPCRGYQHVFNVDELKVGKIDIPPEFQI